MAVPAGDVGGVEAGHGLGFDDEILDALVERVAEVDGAVGVGGTVVEDVFGLAGAGGADLAVEVVLLPLGEACGLVLREIGLHGKGGLGQVEGGFERLGAILRGLRWCFRHSILWVRCWGRLAQTSIVSGEGARQGVWAE